MTELKYNPLKRDFVVRIDDKYKPCSIGELLRVGDADISSAAEVAQAVPDSWVKITPHKSSTLRVYR